MAYQFSGIHIVAEFYEVNSAALALPQGQIEEGMKSICQKAGVTHLATQVHTFSNGGYTSLTLLAESHIAIHTYPECNGVFLDIFTCGKANPQKVLDLLVDCFKPGRKQVQILKRGNQLKKGE